MDIQVIFGKNKELFINHKAFDVSNWSLFDVERLRDAMDVIEEMVIKRDNLNRAPQKIIDIMVGLGCEEGPPGIFRHPKFLFEFDMSKTDPNKAIFRLGKIFHDEARKDFVKEYNK